MQLCNLLQADRISLVKREALHELGFFLRFAFYEVHDLKVAKLELIDNTYTRRVVRHLKGFQVCEDPPDTFALGEVVIKRSFVFSIAKSTKQGYAVICRLLCCDMLQYSNTSK